VAIDDDRRRVSAATPKLLGTFATKLRIALVSGAVLCVGAWLAPSSEQTALPASEERAAPLLEQRVQLQAESRPFAGVQDVGARVAAHTAAIVAAPHTGPTSRNDYADPVGARPPTAGFGVFVSGAHVLTHSAALEGRSIVDVGAGGGATTVGRVVAYERATGLVLLQTEGAVRPAVVMAAVAPQPGALTVAVGRRSTHHVVIPVFITETADGSYGIGSTAGAVEAGMPLFTTAGELFAIAAPTSRGMRAVPVGDAVARLLARATAGERPGSLGLEYQAIDGALAGVFGDTGVVVTGSVEGSPADAAGIVPGDVLLAIGGVAIDSPEAAARALSGAPAGVPIPLRVVRDRREIQIEATPAPAYEIAALGRSRSAPSAPEARTLFAPSVLRAAAIPGSARILSVNGREVTSRAEAQRALRAARAPLPVLVDVDDRRVFFAIGSGR
jgi:S1-C subfamily serine protease